MIDIKPNNTFIFYRGKNYVQSEVMSLPNTLSKAEVISFAFFLIDQMYLVINILWYFC